MARIPALNAQKGIRALKRAGFKEDRQKGSHLILIHPKTGARTVVPVHAGGVLKRGLLFSIIRDAQLSINEFLKLL